MEADNSPLPSGLGRNLTFGLQEILGRAIVAGDYRFCPFPTESDLAKWHGVSRSVTREAVKMLGAKGLLGGRAGQGTFVRPIEAWSLLDTDVLRWLVDHKSSIVMLRHFFELCASVEPAASALAASCATANQLAEISEGLERMHMAQQNDDAVLEADIAFHIAILNASNNPFFVQLREFVSMTLRASAHFTTAFATHSLWAETHMALHQAIVTRHPSEASEAMVLLIDEHRRLIERVATQDSTHGEGR